MFICETLQYSVSLILRDNCVVRWNIVLNVMLVPHFFQLSLL